MLIDALKKQFANAFTVLEAAVPSFTDEQWRRGSAPFNGPARAVAHVLQCAEYYTCGDRAVFANLGKPVWQLADAEAPSQEAMLAYLRDARTKTLGWIDGIGDAGLARAWALQAAEEASGLEWLVYALRHLQHHTGELCAYQKQCGLEPAPWQ